LIYIGFFIPAYLHALTFKCFFTLLALCRSFVFLVFPFLFLLSTTKLEKTPFLSDQSRGSTWNKLFVMYAPAFSFDGA